MADRIDTKSGFRKKKIKIDVGTGPNLESPVKIVEITKIGDRRQILRIDFQKENRVIQCIQLHACREMRAPKVDAP